MVFLGIRKIILLFIAVQVAAVQHKYELSLENHFISPDCVEKMSPTVNGEFPARTMRVKQGDELIVTVYNNLFSESATIHFHGIYLKGSPWYDGHGMYSQCPIHPGQNFTYKITIDNRQTPGTYFYHADFGSMDDDGVIGVLIVEENNPGDFYPVSDGDYSVLLHDWHHESHTSRSGRFRIPHDLPGHGASFGNNILFNGKGTWDCENEKTGSFPNFHKAPICGLIKEENGRSPPISISLCPGLEVFEVEEGNKYKFRFVSTGYHNAINVVFENHTMEIIELDGQPTIATPVADFDITSGQRVTVLITMDQPVNNYWISADSFNLPDFYTDGMNTSINGAAILRYVGASASNPDTIISSFHPHPGMFDKFGPFWPKKIDAQKAIKRSPKNYEVCPNTSEVTRRIIVNSQQERILFDRDTGNPIQPTPGKYETFNSRASLYYTSNRSAQITPHTPVLHDLYYNGLSKKLTNDNTIFFFNKGDVVDFAINMWGLDYLGLCLPHAWYLHGHSMWKVGEILTPSPFAPPRTPFAGHPTEVAKLEYLNLPARDVHWGWLTGEAKTWVNYSSVPPKPGPAYKDPKMANRAFDQTLENGSFCGTTILRFRLDNPGVWNLNCHMTSHKIQGLQWTFVVGKNEIPAPPPGMSVCGDITPEAILKKQGKVVLDAQFAAKKSGARHKAWEIAVTALFCFLGGLLMGWCLYNYVNKQLRIDTKNMKQSV